MSGPRPVALVTGGSRGIGRAICIDLARAGHHVVINYRSNSEAAEQTLEAVREEGGEGQLCPFDVSDNEAAAAAMEELLAPKPDLAVLVNNAGVTADGLLAMMPPEEWHRVIDTSLGGFYNLTRPVLKRMVERRGGNIVTISSASAHMANRGQTNYAAAKAGLIAASKTLAKEVARLGIRVNIVAPGLIDTDMTEAIPRKMLKQLIPMARMGRAEEVAKVVTWLCGDDASYVTGAVIDVNGGMM